MLNSLLTLTILFFLIRSLTPTTIFKTYSNFTVLIFKPKTSLSFMLKIFSKKSFFSKLLSKSQNLKFSSSLFLRFLFEPPLPFILNFHFTHFTSQVKIKNPKKIFAKIFHNFLKKYIAFKTSLFSLF